MNRKQRRAAMAGGRAMSAAGPAAGPGGDPADGLIRAGIERLQSGRLDEAERLYRQLLDRAPDHPIGLHHLGLIALERGRAEQAAGLIRRSLERLPGQPDGHYHLGGALRQLGRPEEAAAAYRSALALKDDFAEAHFNLGLALADQGLAEEGLAAFRKAQAVRPSFAEAYLNEGNLLQEIGRPAEALARYGLALQHRPAYPEAHLNRANALFALGRIEEAAESCRQAIALDARFIEAHARLAAALIELGRPGEAAGQCRQALAEMGENAVLLSQLGRAEAASGHGEEARDSFDRALALTPDDGALRLRRAMAELPAIVADQAQSEAVPGQFARALESLADWAAGHGPELAGAIGAAVPFYLAYRPGNHAASLSRYGDIVCQAAGDPKMPVGSADHAARRLRLGIVSGQIRRHSVWDMILKGIVRHLDRSRFELALYHTAPGGDGETDWARQQADRFVQGPLDVKAWRHLIAADRPDILYYPEIGMDPATTALASRRLAPLQAAGWGHPVTSGLPSIDLYLSSAWLEGPDAAAHYRERLVRLPGPGACALLAEAQAVPFEPALLPADRRVARFLLGQTPFKFDPAHDRLIARIARQAAPCRFWLAMAPEPGWASEAVAERLERAFRAEGLDPDRLLQRLPWMDLPHFLGLLDAMDATLDCPSFSGFTTALQAVRRGLPVVTLEGPFLRQRLASGLLRGIGQTELIAGTEDDYVAIACRLAEESRDDGARRARRFALKEASVAALGRVDAVRAFEDALAGALRQKN